MATPIANIAIVWRGDREARRNATPANNRFHRIFEELAAVGIHAEPAVYDEEFWPTKYARSCFKPTASSSGLIQSIRARHGRGSIRCCGRSPHAGLGSARILTSFSQNGRQGSPVPHEASGLGHRHAALSQHRRISKMRFRRGCNEVAHAC